MTTHKAGCSARGSTPVGKEGVRLVEGQIKDLSRDKQHCSNCRFMQDNLCKKNPPLIVPEVWRDSELSVAKATWPEVDNYDWCGAWEYEG